MEEKIMLEKIIELIEDQLGLEGVEITEATRFKEDLAADSLDLLELEKVTTVGSVIEYLKAKGSVA